MLLNIFVKKKILKNKNIYWVVAVKMTASTQFASESGSTGKTAKNA